MKLRLWWRRRTGVLSVVFAVLAFLLGFVAVMQAAMLRSHGWTVPLGNVAEWVAAAGTSAAFGALFYAAREWRTGQAERREREADQARLIIVEPYSPPPRQTPRRPTFGDFQSTPSDDRDVVIRNHSDAPVFDVEVDSLEGDAMVWEDFDSGMSRPTVRPVLQPGDSSKPLTVVGATDTPPHISCITFTFTDAHGRRWSRIGSGQPRRIVGA